MLKLSVVQLELIDLDGLVICLVSHFSFMFHIIKITTVLRVIEVTVIDQIVNLRQALLLEAQATVSKVMGM